MQTWLAGLQLPVIVAGLTVALMLSTAIGRRLGGRTVRRDGRDSDAAALGASMLGILALLIGFTYSLSLARYDTRRAQVLAEANAIGTAANYAQMLPAEPRRASLALIHAYAGTRVALPAAYDALGFAAAIAQSNAELSQLWRIAVAATAADPQSLPAYRYVAALNEMTNVAESRVTSLRNHVPVVVLVVLAATAMVAFGFAGRGAAHAGQPRHAALAVMAVTIALLIALTIDLDRPDRGLIHIPVQPLRDALATLPPP